MDLGRQDPLTDSRLAEEKDAERALCHEVDEMTHRLHRVRASLPAGVGRALRSSLKHQRGTAELDEVAYVDRHRGARMDTFAMNERAVRATEILDGERFCNMQARVMTRHGRVVYDDLGIRRSPDDHRTDHRKRMRPHRTVEQHDRAELPRPCRRRLVELYRFFARCHVRHTHRTFPRARADRWEPSA